MKKFKLFKLLALFVVLITSINAWGQTYKPARVDERKAMPVVTMQGAGMQSQQMMKDGCPVSLKQAHWGQSLVAISKTRCRSVSMHSSGTVSKSGDS